MTTFTSIYSKPEVVDRLSPDSCIMPMRNALSRYLTARESILESKSDLAIPPIIER